MKTPHEEIAATLLQVAIQSARDAGITHPDHNQLIVIVAAELMEKTGMASNSAVLMVSLAWAELESAAVCGSFICTELCTQSAVVVRVHGAPHVIPLKRIVDLIDGNRSPTSLH